MQKTLRVVTPWSIGCASGGPVGPDFGRRVGLALLRRVRGELLLAPQDFGVDLEAAGSARAQRRIEPTIEPVDIVTELEGARRIHPRRPVEHVERHVLLETEAAPQSGRENRLDRIARPGWVLLEQALVQAEGALEPHAPMASIAGAGM